MYDDTVMAKNNEEVTPLASLYEGKVAEFSNRQWFTISPNPQRHRSMDELIDTWQSRIRGAMYYTCSDYVYVCELAGGIRPHFHGVCDVKDKVGFSKKMFLMAQYDNVRLHKEFKQGLEYMFKECDATYSSTNRSPIREKEDDYKYKKAQLEQAKQRRLKERGDNMYVDIPAWMQGE